METSRSWALLLLLSACVAGAAACSTGDDGAPSSESDAPADEQDEQEVQAGVTKLASKLQDPDSLTSHGDNIYFVTTYGFVTQQFGSYEHDIWVKPGSARAKRLYKGIYGAAWGLLATKNGIYEINEGVSSVVRYPLDGSNKEGENLYHSVYGHDEEPEVGIRQLVGDDDGIVIALRTSDDESKPGSILALSPAGQNEKKLGEIDGGATALKLDAGKIYAGSGDGKIYVVPRDGSSPMQKLATTEGRISDIVVSGEDVFFSSDKGTWVKRKGVAQPEKLGDGSYSLVVIRDQLLFGQYKKGLMAMPVAGGASRLVLKAESPSSTLFANNFLWVTDRAYGRCSQTEEGQACAFDGAAYRVKF
jgi:hypothetical protein